MPGWHESGCAIASKIASSKPTKRSSSAPESVKTFIASLEHPFKQEILALRQLILDADPSIAEGIKWNVPSFRTAEHFATMHLRAQQGVQIILHLGAKTRTSASSGIVIADPQALLTWLAKDRAMATFRDVNEIETHRSAFTDIIRQWITHV